MINSRLVTCLIPPPCHGLCSCRLYVIYEPSVFRYADSEGGGLCEGGWWHFLFANYIKARIRCVGASAVFSVL